MARPVKARTNHTSAGTPKKKSKSSAPKSHKADGTPKKRWSAAERAARGHSPRRSGGRPRTERDSEQAPRSEWSEKPRYERGERAERPRYERRDKARYERSDKPRYERSDRPRYEREDKPRYERSDRPRYERSDKPRYERSDKPRYERDDRGDRFERRPQRDGGRAVRGDRPFSPHHDPESRRSSRGTGGERRFRDRDDRPRGDRFREDRPRNDRFREDRPRNDRFREDRPRNDRFRDDRPRNDRFRDDRATDDSDQMSWAPAEAVAGDAGEVTSPGFAELGLRRELVASLNAQGITDPFPIQAATIPDALNGRDVLGRGQTGSGKTLGFGLPTLTRLAGRHVKLPGAVVLVPTRELAMQVADVLSPLASTVGLSVMLVAGGMAYGPQIKAFARGVDVVVATPGRLIDLMDQGAVDLSEVEIAVLDEADHMADLGFLPDVRRILDAVPAGGQRLLFSATLDRGVDTVVREYLTDPITHEVDPDTAAVSTMEHHLLHIKPADKQAITAEIANRQGRTVVFARTQRGADRIAEQLREAGVMAGALHGGLTQGARSRILGAFKQGTVPVLVATDVAARGIHVDDVGLVLQADPPAGSKDYLHRAGRTARAGGQGAVVTLVLPHQRREVSRLVHRAGVDAAPHQANLDDEHVYRATGARKPSRGPIELSEYETLIAPPQRTRKPGFRRAGRPGGRSGALSGGRRPRS